MMDLHIHSTYSDGTFTPKEIIDKAVEKNLKLISITDHDNIDCLEESKKYTKEKNINFLSGIELSSDYEGKDIHILGYFLNENDKKFIDKLQELKNERESRTEKIIKRLNQFKINITYQDVLNESKSDLISRSHIAGALLKKGYVKTRGEAFSRYLGDSGLAYFPKTNFKVEEAVKLIKSNGGLAVIAHPALAPFGHDKMNILIRKLMKIGLDGVEVFYPSFSKKELEFYKKYAKKNNLILTGGSDFHGNNREGIDIGDSKIEKEAFDKFYELYETRLVK